MSYSMATSCTQIMIGEQMSELSAVASLASLRPIDDDEQSVLWHHETVRICHDGLKKYVMEK